ncbi:MAG: HprK-related kinase [Massilia sp.]|nr:HprK-related kinase [Massilia sp.]
MTTVSSLSRAELGERLAAGALRLQTGEFVTCVKSAIPSVADGIGLLYADYPVRDDAGFADFHITLRQPGGLRRWFHPQVRFDCDGVVPFKPLPLAQAFPMFEWVMNWAVSSRANRYLIIHSAVVEKDGLAAILPAPAGSGKSTLCAALVAKGWRLLSDELALVAPGSGALVPLPRPISLKNASIDIIRRYAPGAVISAEVADTVKGTVAHLKAPADSIARAHLPARAAWIIFPKYQAGAAPTLAPVAPARAFMDLAGNSFNYSLLGGEGFEAMAGLIDSTRAYQFTYSMLDDAVEVFSRLAPAAP